MESSFDVESAESDSEYGYDGPSTDVGCSELTACVPRSGCEAVWVVQGVLRCIGDTVCMDEGVLRCILLACRRMYALRAS